MLKLLMTYIYNDMLVVYPKEKLRNIQRLICISFFCAIVFVYFLLVLCWLVQFLCDILIMCIPKNLPAFTIHSKSTKFNSIHIKEGLFSSEFHHRLTLHGRQELKFWGSKKILYFCLNNECLFIGEYRRF